MTTKVRIQVAQKHLPVVVEAVRSDGTIAYTHTLTDLDSYTLEYVHSGQTLRVREMNTQELHNEQHKK